jgi:Flp pilus assembly protein TadG
MLKGGQAKTCRGAALILYTVLLPTILLVCGLAIDLTVLYVVQTRLSSAVDGAALGAGRLLGTPANTSEIAGEFLHANYPIGFWGSYNLTPSISVTTNASLHTIAVNAPAAEATELYGSRRRDRRPAGRAGRTGAGPLLLHGQPNG